MNSTASVSTDKLAVAPLRSRGHGANVLHRLVRNPQAVLGAFVILSFIFMAAAAPLIMPADPFAASMFSRLKPIGTPGYLLGSDELGRDMLSRLILGARLSLFMGVTPVLLAFGIGGALGVTAGYAGGVLNAIVMRTIDVFYAFPSVLLAIALSERSEQESAMRWSR